MTSAIKHLACSERLQALIHSKEITGGLRLFCLLTFLFATAPICSARIGNIIGKATHDGMCYNVISDGTATLFGNLEEYGGNPNFNGPYVIPQEIEYNGKPYTVDAINSAFCNIDGLTAIIIPPTVTYISTAFSYCPNLSQIIFEDGDKPCEIMISNLSPATGSGVEYIYVGRPVTGKKSLLALGSQSLKTIVIGGTKKEFYMTDFDNCPGLETVIVDSPLTWYGSPVVPSFKNCPNLKTVCFTENSKLTYVPAEFSGCKSLNVLNIPSTVSSMGDKLLADAPATAVIVSHAVTPPTLNAFPFNVTYDNNVYVPAESVNAYKEADYWYWNYGKNIKKIEEPQSLTIASSDLAMRVGDSFTLQSNHTEQKYVRLWTSSDNSVATVIDGKVTAVGCGECDIILKCGSIESVPCRVIVNSIPEALKIYPEEATLGQDETLKLNVMTTPSSIGTIKLKWESSDPEIVSVDNDGTVTALNPGTAQITALSDNGISASADITVQKTKYSLSLLMPDGAYVIRNLKEPFTFSVIPDSGWEISSATLNNQEIDEIPADGTFTTPDGIDDCVFAVTLRQSAQTGLNEIYDNMKVIVYDTYIQLNGVPYGQSCRIFDTNGVCIYSGADSEIPFEHKGCFILVIGHNTFKFMK